MRPKFKTVQGILALIDIVDFTKQANDMGDEHTAKYTYYFQETIKHTASKWGFEVVKFLGDAALLFGDEPGNLLEFMLDLFVREKPEDNFGFRSRFRIAAHGSYFQFEQKGNKRGDVTGAESIKVFRMEKYAGIREMLITDALYPGLEPYLTEKKVQADRLNLDAPLKGFDNVGGFPVFYKLSPAETVTGAANLLEQRMNELEQDVRFIPVFGNMYPPVPMDNNFINLSLIRPEDQPMDAAGGRKSRRPAKIKTDAAPGDEEWDAGNDWMFHGHRHKPPEGNKRPEYEQITVNTLFKDKRYSSGIIIGLPGAGKTTILRHLAHKEFKSNKRRKPGGKKIVLLVPCRDIPFYDDWYKKEYGGKVAVEKNPALEYITRVFLFGTEQDHGLTRQKKVEYVNAVNKVKQAFEGGRLVLLVDALDEAPDNMSKERIRELFSVLASKNRLFLTSRPSERVHLQRQKVPMLNVCSLDMEQVREVARHLMPEDSAVYKEFDEAIWREELVVKMAATPMTALLVTAYFQAYGEFDNRFPMYDLLMKFILLKVWEKIKTEAFPYTNMELFFREIKRAGFFEKHRDAGVMYEGLAALCFDLFYRSTDGKVQRLVKEKAMTEHFTKLISENFSYDGMRLKKFVDEWIERFQQDHLLIRAGAGAFVFIHSTVMEYLAAFYMVQQVRKGREALTELTAAAAEKEEFLELETLPMAAGGDLLRGFGILAALRNLREKVTFEGERLDAVGLKALAEVEWLLVKTFEGIQVKSLAVSIMDTVRANRLSVAWVYNGLKELVQTEDKGRLRESVEKADRLFKLSRNTFLEDYLDYGALEEGDEELVNLRKELLRRLVQKEPLERWYGAHAAVVEKPGNVLQLDTAGYHPDDKNFNYYRRIVGNELAGFFGSPNLRHSGFVRACAFSPDGKTMVSASDDFTLKLWDAASGKEIRAFTGHRGTVLSCAFSPDGGRVISASSDNTLKLWETTSGKEIREFTGHANDVNSCAFSPDGGRVLSGSWDKTLKLWDAASGKEIRAFTGHQGYVYSCAFSPDGGRVISASLDTTLKLWDAGNGKEIREFRGHNHRVYSCAFSPDGRRVVSSSGDKTLKLWDAESGKEIREFTGHQETVWTCAFSPDGGRVVSASSDKCLNLWDAESGREIHKFTGHNDYVLSCAFSPDGGRLVSASSDNTLKLWDAESGKQISVFTGHNDYVTSCAFSPNGERMVSGSSDNALKLWDAGNGKEIRAFNGHQEIVWACAFSPDGGRVVSASKDNTLKLWDASSGKEIRAFNGHQHDVLSCAFSPDGGRVVSGSGDNTLKLWDAARGKENSAFIRHQGSVDSCAFSPDGGRVISGSSDKTLKLWDAASGKEIHAFFGHKSTVSSCAFSPDGEKVVSASSDNTLKLWDAASGKEIRVFNGHKGSVSSCAFSPDGGRVVSSSWDNTLKLWDTDSGKELKSLELPWIPRHVAFSPQHPGKVITANTNGTVTMFEFE